MSNAGGLRHIIYNLGVEPVGLTNFVLLKYNEINTGRKRSAFDRRFFCCLVLLYLK